MLGAAAVIDNERYKRNISRTKLTKGLCSQQLLAKSARSNYNLEQYLFIILLERLGLTVDNLEFILSKNEYDKMYSIDKIQTCIMEKNFIQAKSLLAKYFNAKANLSPIEIMFYNRSAAEIMLYTESDKTGITNAKKHILKAINSTLPGINYENYNNYLYSTYEYENTLLYAKSLCLLNDTTNAYKLLLTIYNHTTNTINDRSLLARILPKCVYLLAVYCRQHIPANELINYLEYAIELLRTNYIIYFTQPLLTVLLSLYEEAYNKEKLDYWRPYSFVINEIINKYYPGTIQDSILFHWVLTSYHLDYEIIRSERSLKRISQDELSSEIYQSPVSISRLANAISSPRKRHYDELFKELGLNKPRFGGFILTDSFEYLKDIASIRELLGNGNLDTALRLINTTIPQNAKEESLLDAYRALVLISQGKDTPHTVRAQIESFFNEWYPLYKAKYLRKPFQEEADILGAYIYLLSENNPSLGFEILSKIKYAFENSDCDLKYNYRAYGSFSILYIRHTTSIINDDAINDYMNKSIKYALSCGKGNEIYSLLWAKIVREGILNQKISLDLEYQSYILAEFFYSASAQKKKYFYEKDKNELKTT